MTNKILLADFDDEETEVEDKSETTGVSAPIEEPEVKPEESSGVDDEPEPEPEPKPTRKKRTSKRTKSRTKKTTAPKAPIVVQMQSQWPGRLIMRGTPSGKEYIFERAGVILGVDPQDVDFILSRNRTIETHGRGCCGGNKERIYVQLV